MDHTYTEPNSLKTLEDLALLLTSAIMTLNTLHNMQVRAISIGIMKEDMNERGNTIAWDLRRLMKLYQTQLEEVLSLLPEDFNAETTIKKLQEIELRKAIKKLQEVEIKKTKDLTRKKK